MKHDWLKVILKRYSDPSGKEICCSFDSLHNDLSKYINELEYGLENQIKMNEAMKFFQRLEKPKPNIIQRIFRSNHHES